MSEFKRNDVTVGGTSVGGEKYEMIGHADHGMSLQDLRDFVDQTQHLKGSIWMDCRVGEKREVAALMDLVTFAGPNDRAPVGNV